MNVTNALENLILICVYHTQDLSLPIATCSLLNRSESAYVTETMEVEVK